MAPLFVGKQEGVRVGNVTVLAQSDEQKVRHFKQRLIAQSYKVKETAHFVICQKPSENRTILIHTFSQAIVDADLIAIVENELPASGILASEQDYGAVLFAIIASTFPSPRNQPLIWRRFCLNTLDRLRALISEPRETSFPSVSHIVPFAAIYQRVVELFIGQSLLDVGSSFGFLPVLVAEHSDNIAITACDNNPDAISLASDLAAATHTNHAVFLLKDVLSLDFPDVGHFDTVTAIHLLEHLAEQELPLAFTHLLQVASKRLIIAVPYEKKMEKLYGHQQVFTPEKLDFWGRWCIKVLGGAGYYWCEEVMGGLLVIERSPG
jgi:SAM-dependent methyltransferase